MSRCALPLTLTLALVLAVAPAAAQTASSPASIDPGMTREAVIARFGAPSGERSRGEHHYLFFANGRERTVGTADVVILRDGRVVDAVLRHPDRRYSGTSSSPAAITAREALRRRSSTSGSTTIPPSTP